MNVAAIVILGAGSLAVAKQIQLGLANSLIYGLASRTQGVDRSYENFGDTLRELFQAGKPILALCSSGIIIRTLAPLLQNKWQEPPVIAIAEDGSAVVPLLGGLQGVNALAREIGNILGVNPALTSSGDIRFRTALLSPPPGYSLVNPNQAKQFIADLLGGEKVKLIGRAPWLETSQLPFAEQGKLRIEIRKKDDTAPIPPEDCLVYAVEPSRGKLAIVGLGPGAQEWMSAEVRQELAAATDWVGYQTYLDLVEYLRQPEIKRHASDNRVESDRAQQALDLAAQGKRVVLVSSGDPGIYAMAAAVFEVLETVDNPLWQEIEVQICPGISAMQGAAARIGAPLGHDFCVISLSDILKPWPVIARRIQAAAQADLVIAFYNPISNNRRWQLSQAQNLILESRSPETPVILAQRIGRKGEKILQTTLGELRAEDADMQTLVLVGSSQTRTFKQGQKTWVYTPRRYQ